MRNMVTNSDKDRFDMIRKNADLDTSQDEATEHSSSFQSNLRKIADLEREHIKLTANQSLAEVSKRLVINSWVLKNFALKWLNLKGNNQTLHGFCSSSFIILWGFFLLIGWYWARER